MPGRLHEPGNLTPAANTGEGTGLRVAAEAYRLGIEAQMCGRRPKVRVLGLAVAGMLALTAPIAGHAALLGSSMKQLFQRRVSSKCGVAAVRAGTQCRVIGAGGDAEGFRRTAR